MIEWPWLAGTAVLLLLEMVQSSKRKSEIDKLRRMHNSLVAENAVLSVRLSNAQSRITALCASIIAEPPSIRGVDAQTRGLVRLAAAEPETEETRSAAVIACRRLRARIG